MVVEAAEKKFRITVATVIVSIGSSGRCGVVLCGAVWCFVVLCGVVWCCVVTIY